MPQLIPFFFANTALFTFILLIIINGIIFLNVLLVVSYYLYNLLKKYMSWVKFENFMIYTIIIIVFIIISILSIGEAYAQTPEPELNELMDTFLAKKTEFYNDKEIFDIKAKGFSNWFNDRIDKVEFTRGQPTPQFKYMADSVANNDALEDYLLKRIPVIGKEIHVEACSMLDRVSELENMEAQIHTLSQTNFDKTEYQKLTLHFFQYRSSNNAVQWYAIKHPNKILMDMDLKNRYF
jgi:hypothetical protein